MCLLTRSVDSAMSQTRLAVLRLVRSEALWSSLPMFAEKQRGQPRDEPLKAQWATIIHYEKDIFHFPLPHSFDVRTNGFFKILNSWEYIIYWMNDGVEEALIWFIFKLWIRGIRYRRTYISNVTLNKFSSFACLNNWAVLVQDKTLYPIIVF